MSSGAVGAPGVGPERGRSYRPLRGEHASEAGFGLVEMCITVLIIGVALVPLIMTMATASQTSVLVTQRSQAEAYARQLGEVARSQLTMVCSNTPVSDYDTALHGALPSNRQLAGFTFAVTDVRVATDPNSAPEPTDWPTSCDPAVHPHPPLQWVEITVTADDQGVGGVSVGVVLRNVEPA